LSISQAVQQIVFSSSSFPVFFVLQGIS
jgi:hypothetical protein